MIYFDNAATGGFKPSKVYEAVDYALKNLNANAGRSGHKLSIAAAEALYSARKTLADFFGASSPEKVAFAPSCTYALNQAIFGLFRPDSTVIATVSEHNAVLRPLFELKRRGLIKLKIIEPQTSVVVADDVKKVFSSDVSLVCVNGVSNVTGAENDVSGIGEFLANTDALFLVDGAQMAGHLPINVDNQLIDALCVPSHKGLLGVVGSGALLLSSRAKIRPTVFGGVGFDSFNEDMPEYLPERLEAGTLNLPSILSLKEGIKSLENNAGYVANHLKGLTEFFISELSARPFVKIYSIPNSSGIVAFEHKEISSQRLAEILSEKYDVAVRGGFHCAPLFHKFLKTEKLGLVRASLSPYNTRKEINFFLYALDQISLAV